MKFTDLFIRKPVLAMVVSLLILVLGLRSPSASPSASIQDRERGGDHQHRLLRG